MKLYQAICLEAGVIMGANFFDYISALRGAVP